MTRGIWLFLFIFSCYPWGVANTEQTLREDRSKMGSPFQITVVCEDEAMGKAAIKAAYEEIDRLEEMISSWRDTSYTSRVNRSAGVESVEVPPEMFRLVSRALKVSELTEGAFDITFQSAGKFWDFKKGIKPDPEILAKAVAAIDYRKVILDKEHSSIFLKDTGTRIGFGAIGKGFAANRALFVLKEYGIANALVNAGGDLVAMGMQADGQPWHIKLAHPRQPGKILAQLNLTEQAVVTSGDYERFFTIDGERYSHIIDPRTGWPVRGTSSVTIICPDAELADALATSVFVMGQEKGMALVNRLKGVEAIIVTEMGDVFYSRNVQHHTRLVN